MKKPSLLIIFLTVFIDLIGFGIVLPLLPRYGDKYGAEGFTIGLIVALFSVMQFFFAPVWGRLSDRLGRRPVILISVAGSTLSYAMFALSAWPGLDARTALAVLIGSRVFAGICGANISVASAYVADITPKETRSKGMALIGVAFGLGFIFGPALGALSASWFGLAGPGWVAAGLCGSNFLLACFILKESRHPGGEKATARPGLAQWSHTLRTPRVGLLVGLYFLATFCFACFETTLPLLLGSSGFHPDEIEQPRALLQRLNDSADPVSLRVRERLSADRIAGLERAAGESVPALRTELLHSFNALLEEEGLYDETVWAGVELRAETSRLAGKTSSRDGRKRLNRLLLEDSFPGEIKRRRIYFDERRLGYLFAYCGLVSALAQGGLIGRLVKRFGEAKIIVASLLVVALGMALIPYSETLAPLLVSLALLSAGSGINRAPTLGLISIHTPAEEQGSVMGVTQSSGTLARIFGPVLAATLYSRYPHSPYLACAVIALVAAGVAWWWLCRRETPTARGAAR